MRCPYCGGLNQERAAFCVNCGRDLKRIPQNAQAQHPPAQTPYRPQSGHPAYPPNQTSQGGTIPAPPPRPTNAPQAAAPATSRRQATAVGKAPAQAPLVAPAPALEPEPPAPFPPRTLAQFEALLASGVQTYTVVASEVENGKKIVSIAYPRCVNWQQAATLLKALKEQQEEKYPTTIIRGVFSQQNTYGFTNGQLQLDRNVRLGSQTCKRYTVETGNGYAIDSVRFVLNE